jgi:DNA-binding NarL/FixJ family response regulator
MGPFAPGHRRDGSENEEIDRVDTLPAHPPSETIRVAIVDDQPVARRGVEHILTRQPGFEIACSAESLAEFENAPGQPDVMILDLLLGEGRVHPDRIARLAARYLVLMISAWAEPRDIVAAVGAGASGYLTKNAPDEEYIEAVRTVAAGDLFLSSQLADAIAVYASKDPDGSPVLSPREQETLRYIAQGLSLKQVARQMAVSLHTVEENVKRIRAKIGPGTLVRLVVDAIKAGLIDLETL